jgi:hypothetical protein
MSELHDHSKPCAECERELDKLAPIFLMPNQRDALEQLLLDFVYSAGGDETLKSTLFDVLTIVENGLPR